MLQSHVVSVEQVKKESVINLTEADLDKGASVSTFAKQSVGSYLERVQGLEF